VVERRGILPTFAKAEREVADRRPAHRQLDVVPGGPAAVALVELDRLLVTAVNGVVVAPPARLITRNF
jgi:hypothetical protein